MTRSSEGIRSRKRVKEQGEVFTPSLIVKHMLDLLPDGFSYRIEATYLEPACGDGAFLVEILHRKLLTVWLRTLDTDERSRLAFVALNSIYGIDLMGDNVVESRARMREIAVEFFEDRCGGTSPVVLEAIDTILRTHIVCANTLACQLDKWDEWGPLPITTRLPTSASKTDREIRETQPQPMGLVEMRPVAPPAPRLTQPSLFD